MKRLIQIISAPSILGLKPTGVDKLGDSLLAAGLAENISALTPVIDVKTYNDSYSFKRDPTTHCLNPLAIRDFSLVLMDVMAQEIQRNHFSLVLGGDCSIMLGIMPALKKESNYGLIFLDAHADFYAPTQSTGEVADMDLAIITGRGPEILTNIGGLKPYIADKQVIHIGQRDAEETKQYHSQDIRDSGIHCFDLAYIHSKGVDTVLEEVKEVMDKLEVDGYWIHFDTDVLHDEDNPAVDYRLADGLRLAEVNNLLKSLLATEQMVGISITIFNPSLDPDDLIANNISACLGEAFA